MLATAAVAVNDEMAMDPLIRQSEANSVISNLTGLSDKQRDIDAELRVQEDQIRALLDKLNIVQGAPQSNPFGSQTVNMSAANVEDDPQIMKVSDLAISEEREEPMRVSLLDETIVVKHINESAITKDQESVSLVNDSYLIED